VADGSKRGGRPVGPARRGRRRAATARSAVPGGSNTGVNPRPGRDAGAAVCIRAAFLERRAERRTAGLAARWLGLTPVFTRRGPRPRRRRPRTPAPSSRPTGRPPRSTHRPRSPVSSARSSLPLIWDATRDQIAPSPGRAQPTRIDPDQIRNIPAARTRRSSRC